MKKIIILLLACFLLAGCSLGTSKGRTYNLSGYGKYSIPRNAVLRSDHSTYRKLFFVKSEDRRNSLPNNISVEGGTNKYSKDDHMQFKTAIQSQLYMQTKGYNATIKGSGSTTKNGNILYTFVIESTKGLTIQYYIVGDYKYVLVHETVQSGSEDKELDNIAKYIIDSFVWE